MEQPVNFSDESLVYTDVNSSGCNECGAETFNIELSDKASDDNYAKGVSFTTYGDKVRLMYDGQLVKNGATEIYAIVNTLDTNNARNSQTFPMNSTHQKYELSVPVQSGCQISVSFKDASNKMDDNSGKNYSYYIQ